MGLDRGTCALFNKVKLLRVVLCLYWKHLNSTSPDLWKEACYSSISPWMKIKRGVKIRRAVHPCALSGEEGPPEDVFTAVWKRKDRVRGFHSKKCKVKVGVWRLLRWLISNLYLCTPAYHHALLYFHTATCRLLSLTKSLYRWQLQWNSWQSQHFPYWLSLLEFSQIDLGSEPVPFHIRRLPR